MERVHGFCGRKIFPKESGENLLLEASSYLHSCTGIGGGFLAGRAIWLGAMKHYPDIEKVRAELQAEGQPYMRSINELTEQSMQLQQNQLSYMA